MKIERFLLIINQITLFINIYCFIVNAINHYNMMYLNGLIIFMCMILDAELIDWYEMNKMDRYQENIV